MNQQLMRRLDAWAGKLLCLLLTLHRKVFESRQTNDPLRSILFIKLIEQGASVLAADALNRAYELVGRENVYICVFVENRPIIDLLEQLPPNNVWALRNQNIWVFALDLLRMLRKAHKLGITATVDLEFFSRGSAIIGYLTRAKRRVGLHRFTMDGPYRGDLMTHRISYNPYMHTSKTYRALVEVLAQSDEQIPINKMALPKNGALAPLFSPTVAEVAVVKGLLKERFGADLPSGPLMILNPNASDLMPLRKWPTERFLELARRLLAEYPEGLIILTGAPREAPAIERIMCELQASRVISVAGATTMSQLVTLFTLCNVLVTNDSGPAHFASMTSIQNIVLFGPETPQLYGPIDGHPEPIWAQLACSPCINALNHRLSPCNNNLCMQAITVDMVFAKVTECLSRVVAAPMRPST
jgi:ADP-heptose:LPS heptosyltransferase